MSKPRVIRFPLLATPLALALTVGVLAALPSRAADAGTHTDTGTATLPAPVGFGATDTAFSLNCPDAGDTQGVDGWVFALPDGLDGGRAVVAGSDGADVAAYVYDDGCGYLRSETASTAGTLSFTLGATDRYLSVYSTLLPEVTFDLSVSPAVVTDPTGTPTATATATATGDTSMLRTRHGYSATPNDPLYLESPFIVDGTSAGTGQWGMQKVQAPQAWQEARATGAGVQVAILDSGLDLGHPDLSCEGKVRIVPGATPTGVPPVDVNGHGTHVAGVIGACSDNGVGVVGVAPDATLLPFRVLGPEGGTAEDLGKAIRAAADAGAHVINMSLGFGVSDPAGVTQIPGSGSALAVIGGFAEDVDPAIAYAVSKGVVVVAASGNETSPICGYPALADGVVCVGSTDRRDLPAFYSNFALKADGGFPTDGVAIVAPGGSGQLFCDLSSENILSTYSRELDSCDEGAGVGYEGIDGTSMASPHVAGAAALLYDRLGAVRSPENAAKVKEALTSSAVDLGVPGYDPQFGSGRLDVLAAVRALAPVVDPTPTATPTPTETQVPAKATTLTLEAPASGQRTDTLPVALTLKDEDGAPVPGATVEVSLSVGDVRRVSTVTTGPDGTASAAPLLDLEPGTVELSASYDGSPLTLPSGAHQPVQVLREDTSTSVSVVGKGSKETVNATVVDTDSPASGVAGVTLVLVDDKGGQTAAVTDAQGRASWEPQGSARSKTYEVRFAGDSRWLSSSATS